MSISGAIKTLLEIVANNEDNVFESIEPVVLIQFLKTFPGEDELKTHADAIRKYLANRVDLKFSHEKISRMCLTLARLLKEEVYAKDENLCAYQMLFPTLKHTFSESQNCSIDELELDELVLSDDGTRFIEIDTCLTQAKTEQKLKHTCKIDGIADYLSDTEVARVTNHSEEANAFYLASNKCREFKANDPTIGGVLERLMEKLADGGALLSNIKDSLPSLGKTLDDLVAELQAGKTELRNKMQESWGSVNTYAFNRLMEKLKLGEISAIGTGKEKNAGDEAYNVIEDYRIWCDALPESQRLKLFNRIVPGSDQEKPEKFKEIHKRLTIYTEGQDRITDHHFCVEVISEALHRFLRANQDLYQERCKNTTTQLKSTDTKESLEKIWQEKALVLSKVQKLAAKTENEVLMALSNTPVKKLVYSEEMRASLVEKNYGVISDVVNDYAQLRAVIDVVPVDKRIDLLEQMDPKKLATDILKPGEYTKNYGGHSITIRESASTRLTSMLGQLQPHHRLRMLEKMKDYLFGVITNVKGIDGEMVEPIEMQVGSIYQLLETMHDEHVNIYKKATTKSLRKQWPVFDRFQKSHPDVYRALMAASADACGSVCRAGFFSRSGLKEKENVYVELKQGFLSGKKVTSIHDHAASHGTPRMLAQRLLRM